MDLEAHAFGRGRINRSKGAGILALAVLLVVAGGACRRAASGVDTAPAAGSAIDGTVRGTVRTAEGAAAHEGRVVEAVDVATGARQRAVTNSSGGFSFSLKPGRYRVELSLREGEILVREPGVIDVNRPDRDARADFLLRSSRVSRPRGPVYRTDDGLGSPIA